MRASTARSGTEIGRAILRGLSIAAITLLPSACVFVPIPIPLPPGADLGPIPTFTIGANAAAPGAPRTLRSDAPDLTVSQAEPYARENCASDGLRLTSLARGAPDPASPGSFFRFTCGT